MENLTAGGRKESEMEYSAESTELTAAEVAIQSDSNHVVSQEIKVPIPPQPEDPDEEKTIVKELESESKTKPLHSGDIWYALSSRWWKQWKDYVNYDGWNHSPKPRPPPIDNSDLISEDISEPDFPEIKKICSEDFHFFFITPHMWKVLHAWYGGGPPLPRKVISLWNGSSLSIEIRRLYLKIYKSSDLNHFETASFSKSDTVGYLKQTMCTRMGLNPEDIRVWDYHANNKYKLLEDMDQKLDSAQIIDNQPILLEEKTEDGKWPELPRRNSGYSGYYNSGGPVNPGTVGMINLGNTCFMNSSLQCLSKAQPLTKYFVDEKYKADVNTDNPLGMQGEIAEEYANLVKQLWSGEYSAIAPRDFKSKLERFAPQFVGYQQHDSQELLGFLLDGLHEDLNRVKKKPYREIPEAKGRPEEEVANDMWEYHRSRNDSIIVDWFQGQLKSTLICPDCKNISITFDPFMYLSLPLPMKTTRLIPVTLFWLDQNKKPTKYGCEVQKYGTIMDLKESLGKLSGLKPETIVICDVYNFRFFKQFSDQESLDNITERDVICAYELIVGSENTIKYFPLVFRKEEGKHRKSLFGHPLVLSVEGETITYRDFYDLIFQKIHRYLKVPEGKIVRNLSEMKEEEESSEEKEDSSEENSRNDSSDESEQFESPVRKKTKKDRPFFSIVVTDNYGNTDYETLEDTDQALNLKDRSNLVINFPSGAIEFYDQKVEQDIEIDPSASIQEEKEIEQSISLYKCLELFTTEEKLGPDDMVYCSTCKEHRQSTKKFDLYKLPPILVIHLKRFSYRSRYSREKLDTLVDYPIHDLDFSSFLKGPPPKIPPIYDLFAVSNHYGSLGGGHYTAYAKNFKDKKWYKYDDSMVSSIDENRLKNNSSAYVLFYQRRDTLQPPESQNSTDDMEIENGVNGKDSDDSQMQED